VTWCFSRRKAFVEARGDTRTEKIDGQRNVTGTPRMSPERNIVAAAKKTSLF
jgi:hypothetical protein